MKLEELKVTNLPFGKHRLLKSAAFDEKIEFFPLFHSPELSNQANLARKIMTSERGHRKSPTYSARLILKKFKKKKFKFFENFNLLQYNKIKNASLRMKVLDYS
jgi:hypothetical protein